MEPETTEHGDWIEIKYPDGSVQWLHRAVVEHMKKQSEEKHQSYWSNLDEEK